MRTLDVRAARLPSASDPSVSADALKARVLADDYDALVQEARSKRPSDVQGDPRTMWASFIEILQIRARETHAYANGAATGDMSAFNAGVPGWNARTHELNRKFNVALARIKGVKPPSSY